MIDSQLHYLNFPLFSRVKMSRGPRHINVGLAKPQVLLRQVIKAERNISINRHYSHTAQEREICNSSIAAIKKNHKTTWRTSYKSRLYLYLSPLQLPLHASAITTLIKTCKEQRRPRFFSCHIKHQSSEPIKLEFVTNCHAPLLVLYAIQHIY